MTPQMQFRDFARERGYELPECLTPGRFARFGTNGKRGDSAGWAMLFEDCQGGMVGDWRTGEDHVWQANRVRPLTPGEQKAWFAKIEMSKREAEAEREREQNEAATKAREIWERATPATDDHPYLKRKGVKAHSLRVYEGQLVVPVHHAERGLVSVQFISPEGEKRFLPSGLTRGCYSAIKSAPGASIEVAYVVEGFATAASVAESTGCAVVIAFSAGNLLEVSKTLKAKRPDIKFVLCADNDSGTKGNPGVTKATEAAVAIDAHLAVPPVPGDFNDLHLNQGSSAVKAAIAAAKVVPPVSTTSQKLNGEDPGDSWPEPQALPGELPAVQPFAFELLPEGLRGWIEDITERVQCPPEFAAVGAIVALGSIIGRRVAVRPKEHDDWEEFPNLWGAIIGRPGVLKSPALNEVLKPLRRLEARAMEENQSAVVGWQEKKAAEGIRRAAATANAKKAAIKGDAFDASGLIGNDDDTEPQPQRYITNDSSVEALAEVLRFSPNGVLAFRDELSGLLRSLDREGQESARAFYLSAYSGKEPHIVDRIGRGLNLRVDHCCVSMLGSIQPAVMGSYLREAIAGNGGDGLLSRFSLLVWPDTSGEWRNVDRWPDTEHRQAANALFDRMNSLDPLTIGAQAQEGEAPFLRLDDAARACFLEWRQDYEREQRTSEDHPAIIAHFAKYRKLVPALALIFHLAGKGTGPIQETAILRALGWVELLETHARRTYASVQQARIESARALLAKIRSGAVANPIRLRDVYLKGWSCLSDPEDARRAADLLDEMDYLRREMLHTPGRSATVYWINPRVKA